MERILPQVSFIGLFRDHNAAKKNSLKADSKSIPAQRKGKHNHCIQPWKPIYEYTYIFIELNYSYKQVSIEQLNELCYRHHGVGNTIVVLY